MIEYYSTALLALKTTVRMKIPWLPQFPPCVLTVTPCTSPACHCSHLLFHLSLCIPLYIAPDIPCMTFDCVFLNIIFQLLKSHVLYFRERNLWVVRTCFWLFRSMNKICSKQNNILSSKSIFALNSAEWQGTLLS